MSRGRSELREKARRIWERSGRTLKPSEIADKLGVSAEQIRKWKHIDAWEARPRRGRGAPVGNKNATGNKGGSAPPGNKNAWKNGNYESMWLSEVAAEHKFKLMHMETDPRQILVNEITLLEYREFRMMRYINMIEQGWDEDEKVSTMQLVGEDVEEFTLFTDDGRRMEVEHKRPSFKEVERKTKTPQKLERILAIENALSTIQGRKAKCIAMLDQFDRNELTTEELRVRIQRMQLEVNKLKAEAW